MERHEVRQRTTRTRGLRTRCNGMKRLVNLRNLLPLRPVLTICTVTSCVLCAACSLGPPDEEPEITGVITNVDRESTGLHVRIEENPDIPEDGDPDIKGDKVILWVDGTSIWVQRADGSWRKGATDDLQVGRTARAWASYMVDTYPGRGVAESIALLNVASR